jgi:hypothetical protein
VIHGDVTIVQTQATARLTQPCKLISNTTTKNPDPRNTCPSTALLPIRYAQYKVLNDKEKAKHKKQDPRLRDLSLHQEAIPGEGRQLLRYSRKRWRLSPGLLT